MKLSRQRNRLFGATIVCCLALYGCGSGADIGKRAPDFSLEDVSGNTVSLKESRGKIVVLDFWATWCPPCLMSIPELTDLQERYKDKGLVVMGMSVDDPQMVSGKDLMVFKEKAGINYNILQMSPDIKEAYFGTENFSIPTMFIIDREGKIVEKRVGFLPGGLEKSLKNLLG